MRRRLFWSFLGITLLLGGCATVDTAAVKSRTDGKKLVVASTVDSKLTLLWVGTTAFNIEQQVLDMDDFQGTSVMNECDGAVPYTRTHEFKHFTPERQFDRTVIYREFSYDPQPGDDVYYPIRTDADLAIRAKYREEAEKTDHAHVVFGGRLGAYAYLDMENTVSTALEAYDELKVKIQAGQAGA